jgi:two-component system, OmpR family, alkaline phosphatase synthesis response regulator PhoP
MRDVMAPQRTILVVDDDPRTVEIIRLRLENDGFVVLIASDGEEALAMAQRERTDLIVLDLMLPLIDGLDICHILRVEGESNVPIIMVTARSAEDDRLRGLESGADDYVIKPFSPRELSARVTAVLRRAAPADSARQEIIRHGDLVVDLQRVEASRGEETLPLTPTEFTLLATLIAEPERAFTRVQLLHRVFGYTYEGMERTIDVHVANLRKKLEPDPTRPTYITTVYGVGYRFAGSAGPRDAE